MQKIIQLLENDHKKIIETIVECENLLNLDANESFPKLLINLQFFRDFTFGGHHKRENEVLYKWMEKQNPNADKSVMSTIEEEHRTLEQTGHELRTAIANFIKTNDDSKTQIIAKLSDFLYYYRRHIEKEESFIFMIAQGLNLSNSEEEAMLSQMLSTF